MISFSTNNPQSLLNAIRGAIDRRHVTTWSYDLDGDFTHTPNQWARKAWLRPVVVPSTSLGFNILYPRSVIADREVYAVYHGRFAEMMLAHFDNDFRQIIATAQLANGDHAAAA